MGAENPAWAGLSVLAYGRSVSFPAALPSLPERHCLRLPGLKTRAIWVRPCEKSLSPVENIVIPRPPRPRRPYEPFQP